MNRRWLSLCLLGALAGCNSDFGLPNDWRSRADERTFARFAKLCEAASERVEHGAVARADVLLEERIADTGGNFPHEAADSPTYDQYSLTNFTRALLSAPDPVPRVRTLFHARTCEGKIFAVDSTRPDQVRSGGMCKHLRGDDPVSSPALAVVVSYGKTDADGIRSLNLRLLDRANGHVFAEQVSWQLQLGKLKSSRNRKFGYVGFVQFSKTCPLTPADLLVKRAFPPSQPPAAPPR